MKKRVGDQKFLFRGRLYYAMAPIYLLLGDKNRDVSIKSYI